MTVVIADAGPIIAFASIDRLDLLGTVFGDITIAPTVAAEIAPSIPVLPRWISVAEVPENATVPRLHPHLDAGERASILLALAVGAELLVIDDRDGRREASRVGLSITGTAGVVAVAKRRGIIPSARAALEALMAAGLFLSRDAYAEACALAGESPGSG